MEWHFRIVWTLLMWTLGLWFMNVVSTIFPYSTSNLLDLGLTIFAIFCWIVYGLLPFSDSFQWSFVVLPKMGFNTKIQLDDLGVFLFRRKPPLDVVRIGCPKTEGLSVDHTCGWSFLVWVEPKKYWLRPIWAVFESPSWIIQGDYNIYQPYNPPILYSYTIYIMDYNIYQP